MTDATIERLAAVGSGAADWTVATLAAAAFAASWLEWIDAAEKIVIGALTIVLLILRIRAHLQAKPRNNDGDA